MSTLKPEENRRTQKVLGFLVGKGLLWTNYPVTPFFGKIRIKDFLWVAKHVEPRVLEVFPAALLHFPKTFIGHIDLPEDLAKVIAKVDKGDFERNETFKGIRLSAMAKWNNQPTKDGRTKPATEKKVNKTFRMSPSVAQKIETLSQQLNLSQVEWLEKLIQRA